MLIPLVLPEGKILQSGLLKDHSEVNRSVTHTMLKTSCLVSYTRWAKFSGGINQCSSTAMEQNYVSGKEVVLHVPHFHTIAEMFVTARIQS